LISNSRLLLATGIQFALKPLTEIEFSACQNCIKANTIVKNTAKPQLDSQRSELSNTSNIKIKDSLPIEIQGLEVGTSVQEVLRQVFQSTNNYPDFCIQVS
jgi:hypothetical protein